jgi:16S rRNA (guanine527-N7)-methyltransferase
VQLPPTPADAALVFGGRLSLAERFVEILADTGTSHGLIGPRETPRLWERHVLNCAVVERVIPTTDTTQQLIDVGSGAGLPGVVLAIARPDLHVHLVEPLARRTTWLSETVTALGLDNTTVHTARAESLWGQVSAPWVTARAVSNLRQLALWCLPLLEPQGRLLALKGERAATELEEHRASLAALGVVEMSSELVGQELIEPTHLVTLRVGAAVDRVRLAREAPGSAGSARRRADRPAGTRGSGRSRGGSTSPGRRPKGDPGTSS